MHLSRFTRIFVSHLKAIQVQSQCLNVNIIIDCQLSASGRYTCVSVSPYVARDSWPLTNQRPVLWLLTNQRPRSQLTRGGRVRTGSHPGPGHPLVTDDDVRQKKWSPVSGSGDLTSVISDPWSELSVHCRQPGTYLRYCELLFTFLLLWGEQYCTILYLFDTSWVLQTYVDRRSLLFQE